MKPQEAQIRRGRIMTRHKSQKRRPGSADIDVKATGSRTAAGPIAWVADYGLHASAQIEQPYSDVVLASDIELFQGYQCVGGEFGS